MLANQGTKLVWFFFGVSMATSIVILNTVLSYLVMVMVNVLASNGLSQCASVSSWYIEELLKLAIEQQVYMLNSPEFFTSKVREMEQVL